MHLGSSHPALVEPYLQRFDVNLTQFLQVEKVAPPILQRYVLARETVWLRELVDVSEYVVVKTKAVRYM
jgi:hypothetical protein